MLIFLSVMFGLEPDIHGHKALAHDMHAESIALRQSFAPQPMLRSSWQQLVISVFFSSPLSFPCLARESKRDVRVKPEHDIEKEAEHDYKEKEAEHNKEKSPLI